MEKTGMMKVLIVDDNPKALAIARARLLKEDLEVLCAEDGSSGMEIARKEKPDLILLDVDMPGESGFDVCCKLKDEDSLSMIPVIFLTAADDNDHRVRGLDLGAVDYVTKPFDAFELRARVRAALRTKKLQDQLSELNLKLEERVEERTSQVNNLLRQKDAFVNQLSHDLKTPLTPLVALLPMVADKTEDKDAKKMLHLAMNNVSYMKNLTEMTLQFAQLNSSSVLLNLERVDLAGEIKDTIENLSSFLKENGISVVDNMVSHHEVDVDRLLIKELIYNLISNAVKYSDSGGVVTFECCCDSDNVCVTIQDTGVGMTREQIEHVFEEFYKADSARNDRSSTGLGLSICWRIIEKHRGTIRIESPGLGLGTTVHFSLPACKENQGNGC